MASRMLHLASTAAAPTESLCPRGRTPTEKFAAEEFQRFFEQVHWCSSSLCAPCAAPNEYLFCIGQPLKTRQGEMQITPTIGRRRHSHKTLGGRVIITGGRPRAFYMRLPVFGRLSGLQMVCPRLHAFPRINDCKSRNPDFTYKPCLSTGLLCLYRTYPSFGPVRKPA